MKLLIVLAAFVAVASASLGLGGVGVVQPIATNVITPVVTPVVRSVLRPAVVSTPVLTAIPVRRTLLTSSRIISPVGISGLGLRGATIIGKK